jgi:glycosyltransferase involved in cell wall biosynthesis
LKIVLAVNAHLSRQAAHGPGKVGYTLAKALLERGELGKVICYSADQSVDLPREYLLEAMDTGLKRKLFGILPRIGKAVASFPARRLEERYFDRFASRNFDPSLGDTLVCTKPINPDLLEKAKRSGWRTALATSILHPRFNLDMVVGEQRRLGLSAASVYTDEKRVAHIERALSMVDRIITTNSFYGENYQRYGVAADKFIYPVQQRPHEGVDSVRFCPAATGAKQPGFRILHVSNMTLIKGVQYLIEAWKQIQDEVQGELVLFGPQDANVRSLIKNSRVRGIRCVGAGNPIEEYRQASVFVSPSVSDAGPNTVFEAMACGTPAIVSDHCGISRFITSGKNGFVYRYDDVESLAGLILTCYRDREKLEQMANEALKTARRYPLGGYTEEFLDMLNTAFPEQTDAKAGRDIPIQGSGMGRHNS